MQKTELLQHGKFYHIYNRGINSAPIFFEKSNYEYFLKLYENHVDPIAETYAWCLMKNHFHFLVRIKEKDLAGTEKLPHQCFSNLFNAYAKAVNKKYNRHSSLFQRAFKRKLVEDEVYLKRLILYIHNNPVHHRVCEDAISYPWSSYVTCLSEEQNILKQQKAIALFQDLSNFRYMHQHEPVSEVELIDMHDLG
jgi:putative transposase